MNPRDLVQGIRGIPAIARHAIPIGSTTGASAATHTCQAATAVAQNTLRGANVGPGRQQGVVDGPGFATQRRSTSHKVHDLQAFRSWGCKGLRFDDGGCCWPTNSLLLTPIHREGPGWRLGAPEACWRPSSSVN